MPGPDFIENFGDRFHQQLEKRYPKGERNVLLRYLEDDFGKDIEKLENGLNQLKAGEPIQYILGKGHFYGRDFLVQPGVLIPRGETEELMCMIREDWKRADLRYANGTPRPVKGVDIGTGTGCIPISLYLEWKQLGIDARIAGLDFSQAAIEIARENNTLLGADVAMIEADIFRISPAAYQKLDFVVSNPPYIPQSEIEEMDEHVKAHEPASALFVPDDNPLVFYTIIASKARHWLRKGGKLYVEIHRDFGEEVKALFLEEGFAQVEIHQDILGNPRIVSGIR